MQREIKFRVFCEKHNRMEYYSIGDLICGATTPSNEEGGIFKSETWSQFTGLKDKNGKDIYEGDIVSPENWKCLFTVYFGDNTFDGSAACFCILSERNRSYPIDKSICKMEIVGNIYETPELLNPKTETNG